MLSAVTQNPYMQTPLNLNAGYRAQDKPGLQIGDLKLQFSMDI